MKHCSRRRMGAIASLALLGLGLRPAAASEAAILADMRAFFATEDPARRAELAAHAQGDSAFRRERVGEWLHRLDLYKPMKAGPAELKVPVGFGQVRRVTLRLP